LNFKISLQELSENGQCISSEGTIQHIDSKYIYVLQSEEGLKQDICVLEIGTLKLITKIDCQEQNFAALDSNSRHVVFIFSKGIVEVYDKSTWELLQTFTYPSNGMYVVINEELLLVSIYGSQSALYKYDENKNSWVLLGYPSIHSTPFLSAYYYDDILYTGAMYEEIFATHLKLDGFKKLDFIETWGRYVVCLKVDQDNVYYGAEGILAVYNKTTKETDPDAFEDHTDNHFDIDEKYVFYAKGSSVGIKRKNSWNLEKEIVAEDAHISNVYVDDEFIFFNDGKKLFQVSKSSIL
jgi:hypothetical protein